MNQLDAVKKLITLPLGEASSRYVADSKHCFIWEDVEACTKQWNQIGALPFGLEPVLEVWGEDGRLALQRSGVVTPVRLAWNPTDGLLVTHALSQLVAEESEFRYCADSGSMTQRAFVALPPKVWDSLEKNTQSANLASRFIKIPNDRDLFVREMIKKRPFMQPTAANSSAKPWWQFW